MCIGGWTAVCDDIGRLKLHPSNKISFDTAEAGPGELTGNIGDHPLTFEMTSSNRLKLVPPHLPSGEHRLEIFFNGVPFPGAPKLSYVQDLEVFKLVIIRLIIIRLKSNADKRINIIFVIATSTGY